MTQAVLEQQLIGAHANGDTPPTQSYVKFNGSAPPGISFPTGAGSPRKWDTQAGYGVSGATLIYMGNGLSEFDVVVQLGYLPGNLIASPHWAAWNDFAPVIAKAPAGTKAKFIKIEHPLINRQPINITQVVILDCSQFEEVKPGLWECRIRCQDARVAMPALGKPGGIPGVNPLAVDPNSRVAAANAELDATNQALADAQKRNEGL